MTLRPPCLVWANVHHQKTQSGARLSSGLNRPCSNCKSKSSSIHGFIRSRLLVDYATSTLVITTRVRPRPNYKLENRRDDCPPRICHGVHQALIRCVIKGQSLPHRGEGDCWSMVWHSDNLRGLSDPRVCERQAESYRQGAVSADRVATGMEGIKCCKE